MSLYDKAKVIFSAAAGAGNKDVAYNIKPVEKLKVDEYIENGGFDTDSVWFKSTGVTISGGKANFPYASTGYKRISQDNVFETGKTYKVSFELDIKAGSVKVGTAGDSSSMGVFKTSGKHSVYYTGVEGEDRFDIARNHEPYEFTVDNVSVREVEQKANDFSFVRASDLTATYEGADGLIKKTRENHLTNSNDFSISGGSGGWYKTVDGPNSHPAELTSGQSGYDGSTNAWKLEAGDNPDTADDLETYLRQPSTNSGVQTFSVYAKAGTVSYMRLIGLGNVPGGSTSNANGWFYLSGSGSVPTKSNVIDATIERVGSSDWYRCAITFNRTLVTGVRIQIADGDGTDLANSAKVTEGDNIYIQDAQLEYGLVATPYIDRTDSYSKSTSGIQEDEPRYDYSLDNDAPPVLMLEPQRKNEVPNSEGVVETSHDVTLTVNHGIAPDGTRSSLKVAKDGDDANDRILPITTDNVTLTNSVNYSISAFVKNIDCTGVTTLACRTDAGSNELFRQGFQWTGASLALTSTGASGTRTKAFVESYGNNWWRIGFTFTANSTAGNFELDIDRVNGSATTSIETWGWQLEEGSYVTSYIPTYGSAATREGEAHSSLSSFRCELDKPLTKKYTFVVDLRVDNLERPTTNFDDIFVARSQGALFNEYPFRIEGYYNPNVDPVTYSLRVFSYKIGDTGSGTTTPHTNGIQLGVRNKIAIVFDEDSGIKIFVNGNSTPMAESTEPGQMHDVHFLEGGGNPRSKTFLYGVQAYDEALSDAECVSLTTIS